MVSDFGKALDPFADKLTQAALLLCLLSKYTLIWELIVVFGVCEFGKFALGIVIAKKYDEVMGAKWYGKVNTVVIYVTMMLLILLPDINAVQANILIGLCGVIMIIAHALYFHLYFRILKKKAKCNKS
jgi:cardiolipin synthase